MLVTGTEMYSNIIIQSVLEAKLMLNNLSS